MQEKGRIFLPYMNCFNCSVGFFAELLCKDIKYLT